ncbi:hypothetical protein FQA39_LY03886 [Lamprigera yunnana]|nr:hypothetical protein FQA39_LY03886 [Lamprigera yunnana]
MNDEKLCKKYRKTKSESKKPNANIGKQNDTIVETLKLNNELEVTEVAKRNQNNVSRRGRPKNPRIWVRTNLLEKPGENENSESTIENNVNNNKDMISNDDTSAKGRKRKRVNYALLIEGQEVAENSVSVDEAIKPTNCSDDKVNVEKRKRGRKKGWRKNPDQPTSSQLEDVSNKEQSTNHELVKKCRPRGKCVSESTAQQNVLINSFLKYINVNDKKGDTIRSDTNMDNAVVSNEEDVPGTDVNIVTCAICTLKVSKITWNYHKYRNHNNLAWKIGDPPLDLNNVTTVMRILTDLYKRKKPLYCEKCDQPKKSVMGYLSHKSMCQKSSNELHAMRVQCSHCNHHVLPISMSAHLKFCKGLNPVITKVPIVVEGTEVSYSGSKRKAATKANNFLKELQNDEENEHSKKNRRTWYINFDFQPTLFGKRLIQAEIDKNHLATCWFKECNYNSVSVDEMQNHISSCNYKPSQGFTCKFCMITFSNEKETVDHMKKHHYKKVKDDAFECEDKGDEDNDDCDDEEVTEITTQRKQLLPSFNNKRNLMNGIAFLVKHRYFPNATPVLYLPAFIWSYKFCEYNFCLENLFPLPQWKASLKYERLEPNSFAKYLPAQKFSICTASIQSETYIDPLKISISWKRYKLFETDLLHDDTVMFFCGGPVKTLAWLPTPYNQQGCMQILAVSVNNHFDREYPIHKLYGEPGIIQFWSCGTLENSEISTMAPTLEFCIAHDHNPVWCLEWCPSGCYDVQEESKFPQRLGLLAVGCGNSFIYIYPIHLMSRHNGGKVFRLKPVLKLALSTKIELPVNGIEAHVTKLSWTKAKGHQFLAAGYANGVIGIFELTTQSPLLVFDNDQDIRTVIPYQIIPAHRHAVTALHLYHLNDGRRWLMSGSIDRNIKYWDLDNPAVPISSFTKLIVTDGAWLNHWLTSLHTFDDCCGGGLTYSTIHQPRNYQSEGSSVLHSNSHVSSISGSEWTNSFIQGNVVGEIMGFFPHQLFYRFESDKSFRAKKGLLGYARVVEKGSTGEHQLQDVKLKVKNKKSETCNINLQVNANVVNYENGEPTKYADADDKYGLMFCSMYLKCLKSLPANLSDYYKSNGSDKFFLTKPHIYPFQSINKVVLNPNASSYCYYATGYQAGFVRISFAKVLQKDQ